MTGYRKLKKVSPDAVKAKISKKDLKDKNIHYLNNIDNYEVVGIRVIPGQYKKLPKIEYIVSFEKEGREIEII